MTVESLPGTGDDASGAQTDEGADEEEPPGRLVALYERYLGEPERAIDVYAGFGLFFGGIALAGLGLVTFLWSTTVPSTAGTYWQLREIAIALGMVGLPSFMLGVVVLLPVGLRVVVAAAIGALPCLSTVGLFVVAYPGEWNVASTPDYSALGIALYAVGVAVLAGSVGTSLVGYHLQRAAPEVVPGAADHAANEAARASASAEAEETVDDEQVRQDIDEALDGVDLSWGGVERTETERLKLNTDTSEGAIDAEEGTLDDLGATTTRSNDDVDDAVSSLQSMQGNPDGDEARSGSADDAVAALNEFREQHGGDIETGADADSDGVVGRLRRLLSG